MDDNDDNDADTADLMGKYNVGGKNKRKGEHRRRYRDDNEIEALHTLYEEPKDNDDDGRDEKEDNGDWDDTEEK